MEAVIITIGDEILIGQVIDTNATWIAEHLNISGIEIKEKRTVSDQDSAIKKALLDYEGKTDLVILTGGLGPTRDDITKTSLNEYFGGRMTENHEVLNHIHKLFSKRGFKVSDLNRKQAILPDNCVPLRNSAGTAPGMWFERSGTIFISLPGVPYEMKGLMIEEVLPRLRENMNGKIILHRVLMTQGIPESFLAAKIKDWEYALPENIKLAYLPRPGIVRLRLTAIGENREELSELLKKQIFHLQKILPEDIFALEDVSLESVLGSLLKKHAYTLSTAESCTGGRIASLVTSVPGSSAYFTGSVIAYSNQVKQDFLEIPKEIIEKHGAVSQKVVELMAIHVREKFNTTYSIAVSGIAGPSGGSEEKPVGTTWICVSSKNKVFSKVYKFGDHRERNIEISSITALNLLRKMILDYSLK
ncbi:MAG: competence/damage-inducible protein A [Bacteroidota bacterium]